MAISTNGGSGGSGYGSRRRVAYGGSLSEINVTPFVDVVLVLLIIFMLTAHVMEFGIEVDVPTVNMVKDKAEELPVVTIDKKALVTLNGQAVNVNEIGPVIHQRFPRAKGVYVRADKATPWETVAQVTAAVGAAKFQVNMVTQPADTASKGSR
jgi:biopolymer transport protein ExbD